METKDLMQILETSTDATESPSQGTDRIRGNLHLAPAPHPFWPAIFSKKNPAIRSVPSVTSLPSPSVPIESVLGATAGGPTAPPFECLP